MTFTAPKLCQVLSPACELVGELHVAQIGSPPELYEKDASIWLSLSEPESVRQTCFVPARCDSNKGLYGHVLVIAGAAVRPARRPWRASPRCAPAPGCRRWRRRNRPSPRSLRTRPEIMTEPLPETDGGAISTRALGDSILARDRGEEERDRAWARAWASIRRLCKFIRRVVRELHAADGGGCGRLECFGRQRAARRGALAS